MAVGMVAVRSVLVMLLLGFVGAHERAKGGVPKEKHCKAESPSDDGWISQCSGLIKCPESCPKCHLSCKFCGMIYCPRCNKVGSVCQDPRFVGGDGVTFYFHGEKDTDFCLVSDSNFHINAHFIGKRPEGRVRDFTWVQALGLLYDSHKLYIGAKKVSTWDPVKDQFLIYYDSAVVNLPQEEGATWQSVTEDLKLTRLEATNAVKVHIAGLLNSTVTIVPITKEESRVHKYEIPHDDCFAHLEANFQFLGLSDKVTGVLGQTYASDWKTPFRGEAEGMRTLGARHDLYHASSVMIPDCQVSQFTGIKSVLKQPLPTPMPRTSCGSGPYASGFACKR